MSCKKVVEIIPDLRSGGAEKFVVDLSNRFSDIGLDCGLCTLYDKNDDELLRPLVSNSIKQYTFHKRIGLDLKCLYRLTRFIIRERPDAVHVHLDAVKYVLITSVFCKKIKHFATIHSSASFDAQSGFSALVRKFLFKKRFVTPVTISEESQISFEKFYGFIPKLITNGCSDYVPESPSLSQYHVGVDYLFIHAASIQPVKNQMMLLKAFKRLLEDGVNAKLLIMGRVTDSSIFEKMQPFFSERIQYLGEQKNVRDFMNCADAFCLSSTVEGMPITIIEAFSVGCIPITTPVGGCLNMIQSGVNGLLSEETTEDAYYRALSSFVKIDKQTLSEMKEQARLSFVQNYSIQKTADNYLALFNE